MIHVTYYGVKQIVRSGLYKGIILVTCDLLYIHLMLKQKYNGAHTHTFMRI